MKFEQAHRLENLHPSGTRVVFSKCGQLAREEQDTPLTFSSRLKYAYLAAVLGHIGFLNSLAPS